MVKVFEGHDEAREILDEVVTNGIAGISGGRVQVRQKLNEVAELAVQEGHESVIAHSTINHPDTELGYPYDENVYGHSEAKKAVELAYDNKSV
jgi:hypothetical protein